MVTGTVQSRLRRLFARLFRVRQNAQIVKMTPPIKYHRIRLGILALLLGMSSYGFAAASYQVCEADATSQNSSSYSIFIELAKGEIAAYPQPAVSGQSITAWQVDRKNQWSDNSFMAGMVSFTLPTMASTTCYTVTFSNNASRMGTGSALTWAQMKNFDVGAGAGVYDAQVVYTPFNGSASAAAVTVKYSTMLAAIDPTGSTTPTTNGFLWLSGPVVTCAVEEDAATTSGGNYAGAFDLGWHWNDPGGGQTMESDGSHASYSGTSKFASLHPWFIACYYTQPNNYIKFDIVTENMWSDRFQDQKYSFLIKVGASATPSTTYNSTSVVGNSSGTFTQVAGTRWRKTFYAGTAPGHWRPNPNWAYLVTTKLFPNYDQTITVDPTVADSCDVHDKCPTYPDWITTDLGEINGSGMFSLFGQSDWGGNWEGSPMQREPLMWLYNAGSATTANGKAAKTLQMLIGRTAYGDTLNPAGLDTSTTTQYDVPGGGGMWGVQGNIPYQMKEGRNTGGNYYYSSYGIDNSGTGKNNAVNGSGVPTPSASGGSGTALGRYPSRHAFPTFEFQGTSPTIPVSAVGDRSNTYGGWGGIVDSSHWLPYAGDTYLLTGDYYYYEQMLSEASFVHQWVPYDAQFGGGQFMHGFIAPLGGGARQFGWGMLPVGIAAAVAVDGTVEKSYFTAIKNSNLATMEGILGITGTSLTPTVADSTGFATDVDCKNYSQSGSLNRWNWAHCTEFSFCTGTACNNGSVNAITNSQYNFTSGTCFAGSGFTQVTVTGCTKANPGVCTTSATHNFGSGNNIFVWGATGTGWSANAPTGMNNSNNTWIATTTASDKFSMSVPPFGTPDFNTTTFGTLGGTIQATNGLLDQTTMTDYTQDWMAWGVLTALGRVYEMSEDSALVTGALNGGGKRLVEQLLDPGTSPYLAATYISPAKNGAACAFGAPSSNPVMSSWAAFKNGYPPPIQVVPSFRSNGSVTANYACGTHGYSLEMRAASSYLGGISAYNCPTSGSNNCSGALAYAATAGDSLVTGGAVPYFNNPEFQADGGQNCNSDGLTIASQIRFAINARAGAATVTSCALSPSSASLHVSATQNVTATCMYSDGSGPTTCTSDIALFTDDNLVASTSGQTITAAGVGTATITGSTISNSTDCTPDIAVTVSAATGGSSMTPGVKMTSGTILK